MAIQNLTFKMPIDDVFELNEFIAGIFITGHIEFGIIRPNSSVMIVDAVGNTQISCIVSGIVSQSSIPTFEKKMLEFASEYQDDHLGIALIFNDKRVLDCAQPGMFVVMA